MTSPILPWNVKSLVLGILEYHVRLVRMQVVIGFEPRALHSKKLLITAHQNLTLVIQGMVLVKMHLKDWKQRLPSLPQIMQIFFLKIRKMAA